MSIPFNFTIQEVQHKAHLEPTDFLSEKTVSIEGRNYKILGSEEDISLLRGYFASLKSIDFDSVGSFHASLEGVGPYEKTHSVFQKTIVGVPKVEVGEEHLVDIHSLREKVQESIPPSAGAMVVVYEKGKQLPPICVGKTSVNDTIKNYKILLRDTQKQLRNLESQEKQLGPDKTRQAKIQELNEKIIHLKHEISAQESAQPVNMQTAALIGSGAKMFTALLSQILCEKGFLSLSTKLSDVLTEEQFQIFENPELAKDVTLEMLLSHTSGFQYFADDNNDSRKGQSLGEILNGMRPKGIRFIANPGDGIYSYSNQIELAAVFIEQAYKKKMEPQRQELQKKIEKAEKHIAYLKNKRDHVGSGSSGRVKKSNLNIQIEAHKQRLKELKSELDAKIPLSYADIMKAELLDPLGMRRTSFDKPKDINVLRAYREGSSFDAEILDPLMRGAGGLWSCMEDMTKLAEAYREKGLVTSSGKTLISKEGLQDMARVRGVNGNTGLGLNIEGSVVGKGGSVASYEFTMKMDSSKGNAVISMCNFIDDRSNFDPFSKSVQGALDVMYPHKEVQLESQPKLTEQESLLAKEGCPMSQCDLFFKGDRGFVGLKQIDEEPGIILNWNGQTLPIRKLEENRYLILDSGYPGGQSLQIFTGKATGKTYVVIEKEGETNAFQGIAKSEMFFPEDTTFLKDISDARGTYVSTIKGGPTFQFDIDKTPNCQISLGDFPPATALVTKVMKDGDKRTTEVFLQGNCGPFPPDKLFKISRGDIVRKEWSEEIEKKKLELGALKKQDASEKIASLEKQIEDLQKKLIAQKDVVWFFRVADFVNPDNNIEAIPLTRPIQSIEIQEKSEKSEEISTWTQRDLELLSSRRRFVAEKCWDVFVINAKKTKEEGRDYNGLKGFLINTSPNPQEAEKLFEEAIQEPNLEKFISLFNHLATSQVHMINNAENLDAIPFLKASKEVHRITKEDVENLKKYMEETDFSGIVTLSDGESVHTIRSKKFEELSEDRIPFSIHSVGKVFTGALGILMIKDGIITPKILNTPPLEIDPRIKKRLPLNIQEHLSKISLGQAMLHQGMLGDYLGNYEKTIEIALKEGIPPPIIDNAEDLVSFADEQIKKNDYSNLGLLLAGLSIQYHYNKKHGTSFTYDQILKSQILDSIGINLSSKKPENARYNEEHIVASHIEGGPAGGYWTTSEDLQKFGKWLNEQCRTDPKFFEACEKFGGEFYNTKEREISHSGFISSASAHLSSFLDNGITISIVSDDGQFSAPRLCGAIIENMLGK